MTNASNANMQTTPSSAIVACPICELPLLASHKQWRCANNHSFDEAKQGYVNLHLNQHKRSKHPGDSADMVLARQRVLNSGVYQPISDAVNQCALDALSQHEGAEQTHVIDIGCGEGYYTQRLLDALSSQHNGLAMYGIDISKEAIKHAAKRTRTNSDKYANCHWLVASGANMPMLKHQATAMACLFTRIMPSAFARVLKPGGILITAHTGSDHLLEMRDIIYPNVQRDAFNPDAPLLDAGFKKVHQHQVKRAITLSSTQMIADVLTMTPHHFKATQKAKEALLARAQLDTHIDVNIDVYECHAPPEVNA